MGTIYLIHFDKPLRHAQHYIGYVNSSKRSVTKRMSRHKKGNGAKILKHITSLGIGWTKVRIWEKVTRNDERILKNRTYSKKMCPVCNPEKYRKYGILIVNKVENPAMP